MKWVEKRGLRLAAMSFHRCLYAHRAVSVYVWECIALAQDEFACCQFEHAKLRRRRDRADGGRQGDRPRLPCVKRARHFLPKELRTLRIEYHHDRFGLRSGGFMDQQCGNVSRVA